MAWLFELIAIASAFVTMPLHKLGIFNLYYIDVIVHFVAIPVVHLTNDEDTKIIIIEENWYQGLRHMLGVYTVPASR